MSDQALNLNRKKDILQIPDKIGNNNRISKNDFSDDSALPDFQEHQEGFFNVIKEKENAENISKESKGELTKDNKSLINNNNSKHGKIVLFANYDDNNSNNEKKTNIPDSFNKELKESVYSEYNIYNSIDNNNSKLRFIEETKLTEAHTKEDIIDVIDAYINKVEKNEQRTEKEKTDKNITNKDIGYSTKSNTKPAVLNKNKIHNELDSIMKEFENLNNNLIQKKEETSNNTIFNIVNNQLDKFTNKKLLSCNKLKNDITNRSDKVKSLNKNLIKNEKDQKDAITINSNRLNNNLISNKNRLIPLKNRTGNINNKNYQTVLEDNKLLSKANIINETSTKITPCKSMEDKISKKILDDTKNVKDSNQYEDKEKKCEKEKEIIKKPIDCIESIEKEFIDLDEDTDTNDRKFVKESENIDIGNKEERIKIDNKDNNINKDTLDIINNINLKEEIKLCTDNNENDKTKQEDMMNKWISKIDILRKSPITKNESISNLNENEDLKREESLINKNRDSNIVVSNISSVANTTLNTITTNLTSKAQNTVKHGKHNLNKKIIDNKFSKDASNIINDNNTCELNDERKSDQASLLRENKAKLQMNIKNNSKSTTNLKNIKSKINSNINITKNTENSNTILPQDSDNKRKLIKKNSLNPISFKPKVLEKTDKHDKPEILDTIKEFKTKKIHQQLKSDKNILKRNNKSIGKINKPNTTLNKTMITTKNTSNNAFQEAFKKWKIKNNIEENSKIFIANKEYPAMVSELKKRGFIENQDRESLFFDFKCMLFAKDIQFDCLNNNQYVNKIQRSTEITVKGNLMKNLNNVCFFRNLDIDDFFPRSFNLTSKDQLAGFIEYFKLLKAISTVDKYISSSFQDTDDMRDKENKENIIRNNHLDQIDLKLLNIARAVVLNYLHKDEDEYLDDNKPYIHISEEDMDLLNNEQVGKYEKKLGIVSNDLKNNEQIEDSNNNQINSNKFKLKDNYSLIKDANKNTTRGKSSNKLSKNKALDNGKLNINYNEKHSIIDLKELMHKIKSKFSHKQITINGSNNIWILKPSGLSRGRGIKCTDSLNEILMKALGSTYLVQKYIERPLIIMKRKFDIRLWILVTSVSPLIIWAFKEPYIRFTVEEYNENNLTNLYSHLTNNSIGKHSKKFNNTEIEGNMWTIHQFKEHIMNITKDENIWETLERKMHDVVIYTIECAQEEYVHRENSHEIFGFDLMVDDQFNPWLIEVNASPAMDYSTVSI